MFCLTTPKDAVDLLRMLSQTIVEVRSARIDTRAANSIAYLGASFLRALEIADLDTRLKALEVRAEKVANAVARR